jgi:hypothetical protein
LNHHGDVMHDAGLANNFAPVIMPFDNSDSVPVITVPVYKTSLDTWHLENDGGRHTV